MKYVDVDIERALESRDHLISDLSRVAVTKNNPGWMVVSLHDMRLGRVYVWEPEALLAFDDFWGYKGNQRGFEDYCVERGRLRHLEELIEPSFHFFPCDAFPPQPDLLKQADVDPIATSIFRPIMRAFGVQPAKDKSNKVLAAVFETVLIDPKLIPKGGWPEVRRILDRLPARERPRNSFMRYYNESRYLFVVDGFMDDRGRSLDWMKKLYQMRMFLEQPFVDHDRTTKRSKSKKTGEWTEQEIVRVLMRERPKKWVPNFLLPQVSRVTGRKLEFEVDVRAHIRHCHSGVTTQVRAHKRGKLGHHREKVIKVVR